MKYKFFNDFIFDLFQSFSGLYKFSVLVRYKKTCKMYLDNNNVQAFLLFFYFYFLTYLVQVSESSVGVSLLHLRCLCNDLLKNLNNFTLCDVSQLPVI